MIPRLLAPALVLFVAACGSSGSPPPRPPEVPIDEQEQQAKAPPSDSDSSGSSESGSSGEGASGSSVASTPPPPPPSGGSSHAVVKTGGLLSAKECAALSDKGIELMLFSDGGPLRGHSGKQKEREFAMMRQMAANDPNFAKMKSECLKTIQRSQYDCGMKANTTDEWKECLQ